MPNILKNAGFENNVRSTFANWRGWNFTNENVCVSIRMAANAPTGFYQDIPKSRFKSNGRYRFVLKLLSQRANTTVLPTIWVFKKGQDPQPTQRSVKLTAGRWQIVQVATNITRSQLQKVRAELYVSPANTEIIIQAASFSK